MSYYLEITEHVPPLIPSNVGRTYSWTPDDVLPTGNNVGSGASMLTEFSPGIYHANTTTGSGGLASLPDALAFYQALEGTATLTVTIGQN